MSNRVKCGMAPNGVQLGKWKHLTDGDRIACKWRCWRDEEAEGSVTVKGSVIVKSVITRVYSWVIPDLTVDELLPVFEEDHKMHSIANRVHKAAVWANDSSDLPKNLAEWLDGQHSKLIEEKGLKLREQPHGINSDSWPQWAVGQTDGNWRIVIAGSNGRCKWVSPTGLSYSIERDDELLPVFFEGLVDISSHSSADPILVV